VDRQKRVVIRVEQGFRVYKAQVESIRQGAESRKERIAVTEESEEYVAEDRRG
jgi:hypothetical protein